MKNCLIILHEDFSGLDKGYQKIAKERIELLSLKYNIDILIPYYGKKPKKILNIKNINYYFYKKFFLLSFCSILYKLFSFKPLQVALYFDLGFKKYIKKNFANKNYDLKYLFLYRGFENVFIKEKDFVILDLIDPVNFSLKIKGEKSYFSFLYKLEALLCDIYEKQISKYINKVIIISSRDKKLIDNFSNINVFPHLHHQVNSKTVFKKKGNLCFSGNLRYNENLKYISWLIKNIVVNVKPKQELCLIGGHPKMSYINKLNYPNLKVIKNPKNIISEISKYRISLNGKSLYGSNTKIFDAFSSNILPIITKEMKKDKYFKDYPLIANSNKDYCNLVTKLINQKNFYDKKSKEINKFKKKFTKNNLKTTFFGIVAN